jgi:hypothetical protein
MLTRPAPSLAAAPAAPVHEPHPRQWVVDAKTGRVTKRPCELCEVAGQDQLPRDQAVRSA